MGLKNPIGDIQMKNSKVTKYCGEIKAMEQVIGWVTPMVKSTSDLSDLLRAKDDLLDLIAKRDMLLNLAK
tara:strand:- start:1951 stop:2160 length:210 start_codon:yes stop_codon:yes gene_type:complete